VQFPLYLENGARTDNYSTITRWTITLSGFKYTIEYMNEKDNRLADTLSRLPQQEDTSAKHTPADQKISQVGVTLEKLTLTYRLLQQRTTTDPVLSQVMRYILGEIYYMPVGRSTIRKYTDRDRVLF